MELETKHSSKPTPKPNQKNASPIVWPAYCISLLAVLVAFGSVTFALDRLNQLSVQQATTQQNTEHQYKALTLRDEKMHMIQNQLEKFVEAQNKQEQDIAGLKTNVSTLALKTHQRYEDWVLIEVQHILRMANLNLTFLHDLNTTQFLLQAADQQLKNMSDPKLIPVRKAISEDLTKISNTPKVDRIKLLSDLSALSMEASKLPLPGHHKIEEDSTKPKTEKSSYKFWQYSMPNWKDALNSSWEQVRSLVIIRHNEKPIEPMMAPERQAFLEQNLHVLFQQAQWAILQRDEALYHLTLDKIVALIEQHYVQQSEITKNMLFKVKTLSKQIIAPKLPSIDKTLNAVNKLMEEREELNLNRNRTA